MKMIKGLWKALGLLGFAVICYICASNIYDGGQAYVTNVLSESVISTNYDKKGEGENHSQNFLVEIWQIRQNCNECVQGHTRAWITILKNISRCSSIA